MSQFQLNKRWFHKIIDYFVPNNCRTRLEMAVCENKAASACLFQLIDRHEHDVVHALKNERRQVRIAKR